MALNSQVRSVFRAGLFSNKVAIVTGGGTGIGKAITKELLYLGCKVIIASRKVDRLSKAAAEMEASLPQDSSAAIHAMKCNIRLEEDVRSLMKTTIDKYGKIDFLVNNGGGQFPSALADMSLKGWNAVIETNLTGTFLCCREAYQAWMGEHGGSIVNIIVDLWKGFPMMGHTSAARAGIENLTKTAALEWAKHGIRINSVAPGTIFGKEAAQHYGTEEIFQLAIPGIPAKRLGTPEEISAAVAYLLSPAAAFVTGETINVNGGSHLYMPPGSFTIPAHDKMPAYRWESDGEDTNDDSSSTPSSKL